LIDINKKFTLFFPYYNLFIYFIKMNYSTSLNRLKLLKNQLSNKGQKSSELHKISNKNPLSKWLEKSKVNRGELEKLYYPLGEEHVKMRDEIFQIMKRRKEFTENKLNREMSIQEMRNIAEKQMRALVEEVHKLYDFKKVREDSKKFAVFMEAISCASEYSITVRFAYHSVLYYNSLRFLGTSELHKKYQERSYLLEDMGCFALTEFGHGSNVRSIKTSATYDLKTKEFVLHSPSYDSYKWWIGGAGCSSTMSIVFAQLYTKGICYGVHAFLTPIRDPSDMRSFPGVFLGDCGPKVGNDAVDNGYIAFHNYRIPREFLLDRLSQVDEQGNFFSQIQNPDHRFAACIGALGEGRAAIVGSAQVKLLNALTVAGRYSFLRKQFGIDDNKELPIITYPMTQIRIIPALAEHFAYRFAAMDLGFRWMDVIVRIILILTIYSHLFGKLKDLK
jgi:acyl-CoA oxidase